MTDTNTARTAPDACQATERPAPGAQRGSHLGLTWGQRVLAVATAAAILVSGANALVQMARVLAQCWLTPAWLGDEPRAVAHLPPQPTPGARQAHAKGR
jgi:hypothetical protein